ncbi:GNAT domain-containing protein, partial [Corynascus novoguineensis]
ETPSTAVSTTRALLVPYDRRHVLTYHAWMEDPAIQEATASEPLTLEEEYENQESWRASHDKLTFIVCQPLTTDETSDHCERKSIQAGEADVSEKMVGDINLFLYPYEDEDEGDEDRGEALPSATPEFCVGEVDIMIADGQHRGKGLGRAVVQAFLQYVHRNLDGVVREYAEDKDMTVPPRLKLLMAKINQSNEKSIILFKRLGFEQEGGVDYFGEVKLVLRDLGKLAAEVPQGYTELVYSRDRSQDEK